ncbi:ABC transporter ATP-binding protein [Pseudonocardia humida]|uniref:ABC transporter ATP-binding protein n=1 Tax=Pseudonocardia humida TaxID=2800819 RepID=A0ABT1AAN5_9PSEU|nr:oligopeptide/dipeptide ABC transporter ATP-binding protein [Pseudonocardia humida]MCO1659704.1 ABC transporter ATP-binding protein [Pseudonocardia humida]
MNRRTRSTTPPPVPQEGDVLLELRDVSVSYGSGADAVRAVDRVSLAVTAGATMAIIGESGCGKSSLAKAICGLVPIEAGEMTFAGQAIGTGRDPAELAGRLGVQIVLQDPTAGLDPRWPIWRSVAESRRRFSESRPEARRRAVDALSEVGIGPHMADRRPAELSGGQRQRVTIARAIAAEPRLIVLDEAVSALDVSVRNEILVLLQGLKQRHGLTFVFITHDISVVTQCATDATVLYLGRAVETGTAPEVLRGRSHPYTRALLSAVPTLTGDLRDRVRMTGELPSLADPPSGCRFHTRCPFAQPVCSDVEPDLVIRAGGHPAACHFVGELRPAASDAVAEPSAAG